MFKKILIANRGEIACRIIRTARRLGIATVAVYSDADASAMHVTMADEAWHIGPDPARESYLKAERILDVARESGAEAIHPGYGFLSENAGFARSCAEAGIVFIGPPAPAIEAMGSKSAAKRIMEKADVPLVPGYHSEDQEEGLLACEAGRIGFPLLIKAVAGGGGKGMRVVRSEAEFLDALKGAKREALSSFGDDKVLLERYLTKPRHVEIQVFADGYGNAVHLFERDCSVQRRHQKVLEEAPAPGMTPQLREKMGSAAIAAAKAIGYQGAGTVEFLLDEDGSFYFMEMNTRLQVEHPVTEMITGQDLVEWQLKVASGQPLPLTQEMLSITGHAFEARIYAEDPDRDFLPATGRLSRLRTPLESPHVRIDTGVCEGDTVSIHYDPMIAKLIVWDADRKGALRRLQTALAGYQIVGVTTNIGFLSALASNSAFSNEEIDTGFIEKNRQSLFHDKTDASDETLALAALHLLISAVSEAAERSRRSADPWSPWSLATGWQMNCDNFRLLRFLDNDREVQVTAHFRGDVYLLDLPGGQMTASGSIESDGSIYADLGGRRLRAGVIRNGANLTVMTGKGSHLLQLLESSHDGSEDGGDGGSLCAPMPGKIVSLLANAGAKVDKGTPLLIMEAMKMEHTIVAPASGSVVEIFYSPGDLVNEGAPLLEFAPAEG